MGNTLTPETITELYKKISREISQTGFDTLIMPNSLDGVISVPVDIADDGKLSGAIGGINIRTCAWLPADRILLMSRGEIVGICNVGKEEADK